MADWFACSGHVTLFLWHRAWIDISWRSRSEAELEDAVRVKALMSEKWWRSTCPWRETCGLSRSCPAELVRWQRPSIDTKTRTVKWPVPSRRWRYTTQVIFFKIRLLKSVDVLLFHCWPHVEVETQSTNRHEETEPPVNVITLDSDTCSYFRFLFLMSIFYLISIFIFLSLGPAGSAEDVDHQTVGADYIDVKLGYPATNRNI